MLYIMPQPKQLGLFLWQTISTILFKGEKTMAEHIRVKAKPPRIQYIADGISTKFETPFPIFKEDAIKIYFNDEEVLYEEYDISLDQEQKATIDFHTPPENNTIITIARDLSVERTSYFQEGGALRAEALNYEFDYQMACLQQLADNIDRSMIIPPYAIDVNKDLTLPSPEPGKSIMWTQDGKALENSEVEINKISRELDNKVVIATTAATTAASDAAIATQKAEIATQKATEAVEAVDNKANIDAYNFSSLGKKNIVNFGMPDYSTNIIVPNSALPYTIPYNCELYLFSGGSGNQGVRFLIDDTTVYVRDIGTLSYTGSTLIAEKDQVLDKTGLGTIFTIEIRKLKGEI